MDYKKILLKLDEVAELSPGTLNGTESIKDWDSIAIISIIALADEDFNKSLSAKAIAQASTVNDIVTLLTA